MYLSYIYLITASSRRRMWRYIAPSRRRRRRPRTNVCSMIFPPYCGVKVVTRLRVADRFARQRSFSSFRSSVLSQGVRARASVCASCDTWTLGSTPPRVNVRTREREREIERERDRGGGEGEGDGRVEGFVLINITSPARAAQLKSVSASAPPKYSYLSPRPPPSSVTIIRLHPFSFIPAVRVSKCGIAHLERLSRGCGSTDAKNRIV